MAWTNADGLHIKFGTEEAQAGRAGAYNVLGGRQWVEVAIDLVELSDSAQTILDDHTKIPAGYRVEEIEVLVTELTAGTNSNLDFGLIREDRTTELDYNGFLAAADAWHAATVGTVTKYNVGTTEAGALLGTVLAYPGLLVAKADTAAFTDGTLTIRVYFSKDVTDPD